MAFPALQPTSRSFSPGNFPVKTFNAQSGAEVRILYGSERTKMTLSLGYENITDAEAQLFVDHFDEVQGTYGVFDIASKALIGWSGDASTLDTIGNNSWRYDSAPSLSSIRPGLSSVTVELIGVL
jgi:hypothetical protein